MAEIYFSTTEIPKVSSISSITAIMASGTSSDYHFGIDLNSDLYYFDSSGWTGSDRSYSQLSTFADFNSNVGTIPIEGNYDTVKIFAARETTASGVLSRIDVECTHYSPVERKGILVIVKVQESTNGTLAGTPVVVRLADVGTNIVSWDTQFLNTGPFTKYTDEYGIVEFELPANIEILPIDSHWQFQIGNNAAKKYTIPNTASYVYLSTLTPA